MAISDLTGQDIFTIVWAIGSVGAWVFIMVVWYLADKRRERYQ
ncbi:MAG: hypothetical protein AB4206_03320 [Xenococcaceae cyanobacterium]